MVFFREAVLDSFLLNLDLAFENNADPDKMPFHLVVQCLSNYSFRGFQRDGTILFRLTDLRDHKLTFLFVRASKKAIVNEYQRLRWPVQRKIMNIIGGN